jgi:arylsulfatase
MRKLLYILLTIIAIPAICQTNQGPNVILIITDDQGYGDLGYHGNPIVHTVQPHDRQVFAENRCTRHL